MPYVPDHRRYALRAQRWLTGLPEIPESAGELNYVITALILDYVRDKGLSYQTINDVLGALDAVPREFYRRVAVPYEEEKREANGDVY